MQRVFEPTVMDQIAAIPAAQRLLGLRGKRLGFVDNSKCNADLFIKRVAAQLTDRYATVEGPHDPQTRTEGSAVRKGFCQSRAV